VIGMEDMAPARPSAPDLDEPALVAGMQAGDDDAFERCVRRFCDRLLAVTRRILSNDEDARDAIQDAFASAFRQVVRFEARSGLGTWLHRIAVNAALSRLRSRQRRPEKSIEDLLPHFGEDEH
jgi:RNA polymerase sigma-70 factor (ECF subfamily)